MLPESIPGLELCGLFYVEAVRPILDADFPGLHYSAALLGSGSEVLGFDTEMSRDHSWGPRLLLFLRAEDHGAYGETIRAALSHKLPRRFRGYPTGFSPPDLTDNGTRILLDTDTGPIDHGVEILTLRDFLLRTLGFDAGVDLSRSELDHEIEPADWLTFPEQALRSVTAGAVYHDDIGLQAVRDRFAYYPRDVWLYLLAAGWNRIGQEEHLMGRAGYVGDEIGSALIGARLIRDLMRLCFLMERQYAPYAKWFGTAFNRLDCAAELSPHLLLALRAEGWQEREGHLDAAYEIVAAMHNALGITGPLPTTVSHFHGRPFKVIHMQGGFAAAICARIRDPEVQRIAASRLIGGIDQYSDSTDLLCDLQRRTKLRELYH